MQKPHTQIIIGHAIRANAFPKRHKYYAFRRVIHWVLSARAQTKTHASVHMDKKLHLCEQERGIACLVNWLTGTVYIINLCCENGYKVGIVVANTSCYLLFCIHSAIIALCVVYGG